MSAPPRAVPSWTCTCGKRGYYSRRDAQKAARIMGRRGLDAYVCKHATLQTTWHLGHLPPAVRAGRIARADIRPQAIR